MTSDLSQEKRANLVIGAILSHVAQNVATKKALSNPTVGRYIADGFNEGVKGVVNSSAKAKATRITAGALVPDVELMHKELHALGTHLRPHIKPLSLPDKAALRHAFRFGKVPNKYVNKLQDPKFRPILDSLKNHKHLKELGISDETFSGKAKQIWKDKNHPLLSNIASQVGRNNPTGKHFKPARLNSGDLAIGSGLAAAIDPGAGLVDGVKTIAGSKTITKNKYGRLAVDWLRDKFVKKPIEKGLHQPGKKFDSAKDKAFEYLISPTSMSLSRTSAALSSLKKP